MRFSRLIQHVRKTVTKTIYGYIKLALDIYKFSI